MGESSQSPRTSKSENADFNFYLGFAKPLVLNLPDPSDRILAASWIKKLKDDRASEELRTDYLKLLLFVLHKRKLIGPFIHNPGSAQIEEFPPGTKLVDIARDLLIAEESARIKRLQNKLLGAGDYPPYKVELSADNLEYSAAQEIPGFGVHAFYALSTEPIHNWRNTDNGLIHKDLLADSAKHAAGVASTASLKAAKSKSLLDAEKSAQKSPKSPKIPTPGRAASPRGILGSLLTSPERTPVTWGSNLIEVTDPPPRREPDIAQTQVESVAISPFEAAPPLPDISKLADPRKLNLSGISPILASPTQPGPSRTPSRSPSRSPRGQLAATSPPSPPFQFDQSIADIMEGSPARQYQIEHGMSPSPKRGTPAGRPLPLIGAVNLSPVGTHRVPQAVFDSPIITGQMYGADLMDTSMPTCEESFSCSPARTSPRAPTPRATRTSPLATGAAGFGQGGIDQITMDFRDQEARQIIEEANETLAGHEGRIQEQTQGQAAAMSPSTYDKYYRHKRKDMPATPPMFSKYKQVREGPGQSTRYSPGQFGLTADEPFQPGGGYAFQPNIMPYAPSARIQYEPGRMPMEALFPDVTYDADDFLGEEAPDFDDMNILDESMHEELDDRIRRIHQDFALESASLPAGAGVATTTPALPVTPIRRNDYGVEFPLFEEGAPALYSPGRSPESRARAQMRQLYEDTGEAVPKHLRSPVQDPFGLPTLLSDRPSPPRQSPRRPPPRPLPTVPPPRQPSPPRQTPPPTTSRTSPTQTRRSPPKHRTEEEIIQAADAQYAALYESLIEEPKTPKPSPFRTPGRRSPRSPHTPPIRDDRHELGLLDEPVPAGLPSPVRPPTAFFGWKTPPHLKVEKPKPLSPYRPLHLLSQTSPEGLLENEGMPDTELLFSPEREPPVQTPPRGPSPIPYREFVDPFEAVGDDDLGILHEEEPLAARVESHEMKPYTRRGIRGGPVVRHTRLAGRPRVPTIMEAEEDVYYSPPRGPPPQPVRIDFGEPYMMPSSARQRALGYQDSPTRRQQQMERQLQQQQQQQLEQQQQAEAAARAHDESILTDAQEHFVNEFQDPRQQEMMRRVVQLVQNVEGQEPLNFELPAYKKESLFMGSPPREMADIDMIDAVPAPTTPVRQPSPRRQRTPSPRGIRSPPQAGVATPQVFDFAGRIEDYMPEYAPFDFGGAADGGILDETEPFDPRRRQVKESPPRPQSPREFELFDFVHTTANLDRNIYQTHARNRKGAMLRSTRKPSAQARRMVPIRELPPTTDPDVGAFHYDVEQGSARHRHRVLVDEHRKSVSTARPSRQLPRRRKMETVREEVEIEPPSPKGTRAQITRRTVKKRINFDQPGGSPERQAQPAGDGVLLPPQVVPAIETYVHPEPPVPLSPTSQQMHDIMAQYPNLPPAPQTPPPTDLMGVEGRVAYTPRQYLMDEPIQDENLQSPMKLPTRVHGWHTPEHLRVPRSPQQSPFRFEAPLHQPIPAGSEEEPEFFDELSPHRPTRGLSPYDRSPKASPTHTRTVSEIFKSPDGTTTTTYETVEEIVPPALVEISPARRVHETQAMADLQYALLAEEEEEPTTPTSQRIPRAAGYSRTPQRQMQMLEQADGMQVDAMSPPQMFEEMYASPGGPPAPRPDYAVPQEVLDDLVYHPLPPQEPVQMVQFRSPEIVTRTVIHDERPYMEQIEEIVEEIHPIEGDIRPMSPANLVQWQSPPRSPVRDIFDESDQGYDLGAEDFPDTDGSPRSSARAQYSPHTPPLREPTDWYQWSTPPSGRAMEMQYSPQLPEGGPYEAFEMEASPDLYTSPVRTSPIGMDSPQMQQSPSMLTMSPGTAAEIAGFRHQVASHAYTPNFTARPGTRVARRRRQALVPPMTIMAEIDEPPLQMPRRGYVPYVPEGQLVDLSYTSPVRQQAQGMIEVSSEDQMQVLEAKVDAQYAALMESPSDVTIEYTEEEVIEYDDDTHILDQMLPLSQALKLPAAITEPRHELNWASPPREPIPPYTYTRYSPPPRQPERPITPPRFGQDIPQDFMGVDEEQSPDLFGSPQRPRDIFEEDDYQYASALGEMSPQLYESPQHAVRSPVRLPATPQGVCPGAGGRNRTPPSGRMQFSPPLPEAIRLEERPISAVIPRAQATPKRLVYADDHEVKAPRKRPRRLPFGEMPPDTPPPARYSPVRLPQSPVRDAMPSTSAVARVGTPPRQIMPMRQSPQRQQAEQMQYSPAPTSAGGTCENVTCAANTAMEAYEEAPMFTNYEGIHDTSDIPLDDSQADNFNWMN